METIGFIEKIQIKTQLNNEKKINVNYIDFSPELRKRFQKFKQQIDNNKKGLEQFLNPIPKFFSITNEEYSEILNLRDSIIYNRSIDDQKYLSYILQSLKVKGLKELCKEHDIRGYSKFNKQQVISYLQNNLSKEEIIDFLKETELNLVSCEIAKSLQIINKNSPEKITKIKILNSDHNEIEVYLDTPYWADKTFLSINKDNIADPERDCACNIGAENGFCRHFWIGFIFSLKKGYFNLSEWNLTTLPKNIEKMIKNTKIEGIKIELRE